MHACLDACMDGLVGWLVDWWLGGLMDIRIKNFWNF